MAKASRRGARQETDVIELRLPKDEPRMNTNLHEYRWTRSNDKRHQNASATLLPGYDIVSLVDSPSISIVTPANRHLINQFIGVHSCPFVVRRFPLRSALSRPSCSWWMSLLDNPLEWFQASRTPAPQDGRDHSRVKQGLFCNKLPVPGAGKRPVTWLHSIFYEHGCTGLTGREVPAPEAGWGADPVRACGCPGLQASRFRKKILIILSLLQNSEPSMTLGWQK